MDRGLGGVERENGCVRDSREQMEVCKLSSPERIVDDGESELEILDDPVDPSVSKAVSGSREK